MSPLREGVEVSGGFLLLTAWFALVNGWRLLAVILSAALLHETGHLLALYLLGGRAAGVRITVFGAELRTDAAHLSYPAELAVTLAGPAANLACGLLLARLRAWTAAGAHLSLCAFNLLPVRPLDGGHALELLVSWLAGPEAGERIARRTGAAAALALCLGAVWLMVRTGGSLWLLPAAAGLLTSAAREFSHGKRTDFL